MAIVAHNLQGMGANRFLGIVTNQKNKTAEKLSSGYRINRAADDAEGLAISEKMRRQIRGLTQGTQNTQDGISMCQIADGALDEVSEMLHRITELSVKAANGTNDAKDRQFIQKEVNQLLVEIDRVSETTTFNEQRLFISTGNPVEEFEGMNLSNDEIKELLFNGSYPEIDMDVLADDISETIPKGTANEMLKSLSNYAIAQTIYENNWRTPRDTEELRSVFNRWYEDLTQQYKEYYSEMINEATSPSEKSIWESRFENALTQVEQDYQTAMEGFDTGNRSKFARYNADQTGLTFCLFSGTSLAPFCSYLGAQEPRTGNLSSISYIADFAYESQEKDGSGYILHHPKAGELNGLWSAMDSRNAAPGASTNLCEDKWESACDIYRYLYRHQDLSSIDVSKDRFWIQSGSERNDGMYLRFEKMNTSCLGVRAISVSTADDASNSISRVKKGLMKLSSIRSDIGAQQNRLEHTIRHQNNTIENTQAAESQIRDADMAKIMTEYSSADIIQQAGVAMLSQANQSNQVVLSLLQ